MADKITVLGLNFSGYVRLVNIRYGRGGAPLHMSARQRFSDCVHILLDSGTLVCASAGGYR